MLYRDFPDQVKVWEDCAENLVSERQNGNSEVGITADPSLIATMKVVSPKRELRTPSTRSNDQHRCWRHVSLPYAFKQDLIPNDESTSGDEGYNRDQQDPLCGDDADLIIVPGIDFNSNKTSARQGKEGEEHSLDKIGDENFVHAKSGRRWLQKRIT